jgi:hypothetical protein
VQSHEHHIFKLDFCIVPSHEEISFMYYAAEFFNFVYYMYIVNNLLKLTVIYIPIVNTYKP